MVENSVVKEISTRDEKVRQDVLGAARTLFRQYGLLKTTMEDIARATGKGKSTLYYYYETKEAIFEEVIKSEMEAYLSQLVLAVEKADTCRRKLKTFVRFKIDILQKFYNLYSIVFDELVENPNVVKCLKKDFCDREKKIIERILTEGVKTGEFKKMDTETVIDTAYVLASSIKGLEISSIQDASMEKIEVRTERMLTMFYKGIKKG